MVKGLGEHLIWGYQGVEGPGAKGDGGEEIEGHTIGSRRSWARGEGNVLADIIFIFKIEL